MKFLCSGSSVDDMTIRMMLVRFGATVVPA
jgi:hypothetical protein